MLFQNTCNKEVTRKLTQKKDNSPIRAMTKESKERQLTNKGHNKGVESIQEVCPDLNPRGSVQVTPPLVQTLEGGNEDVGQKILHAVQ